MLQKIQSYIMPSGSKSTFNVDDVLAQLDIGEKIALLSGMVWILEWREPELTLYIGVDFWHTASIPRLNVPAIRLSDGPNGVRGTRFFNGVPAACFPCVCLFLLINLGSFPLTLLRVPPWQPPGTPI